MENSKRIAIFGANSVMARDFRASEANDPVHYEYVCFARKSTEPVSSNESHHQFDRFLESGPYDAIVNFIGIGSPRKAQAEASKLDELTSHFDLTVLNYLERFPWIPYVFISSGSVYSLVDRFGIENIPDFENATFEPSDLYAAAKLKAELNHRERSHLNILDLRVFNYVSKRQSLEDGFLFTDIASALLGKKTFVTNDADLVRDFASGEELSRLLKILFELRGNMVLDLFTQAPISKVELLSHLVERAGLEVQFDESFVAANPTGAKQDYIPRNFIATDFGYENKQNSLQNVVGTLSSLGVAIRQ
jgi:nucleoside-diphosphate-sugar epimerase